MLQPEYDAWVAETIPAYAADKVASGQWPQSTALEQSKKENDELLPQGLATPDNHFFTIVESAGAPVGMLGFAVKTRFNARIAYVFDVGVRPERQREGHASAAFVALEGEVRNLGLAGIALQVFGHNTAGQGLYAKLGYRPTSISMFKSVDAAADA